MTALLGPAAAAADLSSGGLSTSLSLATTAANTLVGLAAYVAATQTVQAHAHAQAQVQMHAQAQMPFTAAAPGPTAIPLPEVGGYGTGAGMTGLAGLGVDTRKGMGAWKRDMDDYTTSSDILPTAVSSVEGQPQPTSKAQQSDPLLALMPDFAFSMPAQTVVNGVNLALVAVLMVHLLFTVQYHYPLSRKNYILQMSSTSMLLLSLATTLHIVLQYLRIKSLNWPYMFPYIGVQIPPGDGSWTTAQTVFFLLMRAITTALAHITHIQFLTLLFPSGLEARLILWMLGPLALAASGMEFTPLSSADDLKTSDLGDAIRNICNSTLTLLYTSALLIWGLLVNRRRAWRTDGGTAAFGGGSVGLALINTTISFVEIKYDRVWWLPNVCWTLTIWQSWLGFWWWVGSGMGIGEVEDRAEREERKRKRDERRKRKQEKEERHRRKAALAATGIDVGDSNETVLGGIKRIRDKIAGDSKAEQHAHNTLSRRLRRNAVGAREEEIELQDVRSHEPAQEDDRLRVPGMEGGRQEGLETDLTAVSVIGADDARTSAGVVSNLGSGSSDTNPSGLTGASSARPGWAMGALRSILSLQPNFIKVRIKRLRLAHVAAAKVAATEQSALREQVLNNARGGAGPGLRSMMFVRTHGAAAPGSGPLQGSTPDGPRASLSHSPSAQARRSASASGPRPSTITSSGPSDSTGAGMGIGAGTSMTTDSGPPSLPRLRTHDTVDSASTRGTSTNLSGLTAAELTRRSLDERRRPSFAADREREREHERNPFRTSSDADWVEADDDEEEDDEDEEGKMEDDDEVDDEDAGRRSGGGRSRSDTRERDLGEDEGDSWYWRGGLRQMRLRDRTTYD